MCINKAKEAKKLYMKEWRKNNKEKIAKYQKKYWENKFEKMAKEA